MRIAFVFPTSHPVIGGIETYMKKLAEEYSAAGNDVAVFTSADKNFFGYPLPSKRVVQKIIDWRPDIIHLNLPHPYCTAVSWFIRRYHIPLVATYHGHANPKSFLKKIIAGLDCRLYRFFYQQIIVTTETYKKKVAVFFPRKRICVIPPGVDEIFMQQTETKSSARQKLAIPDNQNLRILQHQKTVLFVGAMDDSHLYKGIPVLLECAKLTPDIQYILIGGGSKKSAYHKMAGILRLQNTTFINPLSPKDLHLYYTAADILVLPSVSSSEGFGLVLIEAMACGTPVITTDKAGSSNVIEKAKAGLIVKAGSSDSLKQGIEKILSDQTLAHTLSRNGRALAKTLTWRRAAAATLQVYEQLITKK